MSISRTKTRRYKRKSKGTPYQKFVDLAEMPIAQLTRLMVGRAWKELAEAQETVRRCRQILLEYGGMTGRRGPKSLKALVLRALASGDSTRVEIYDRVLDLGYKPRGMDRKTLLGRISALLAGPLADFVVPVGHGVVGMSGVRWHLVQGGEAKYRRRENNRRRQLKEARHDSRRLKEQVKLKQSMPSKSRNKRRKRARTLPGEGVMRFEGRPVARIGDTPLRAAANGSAG